MGGSIPRSYPIRHEEEDLEISLVEIDRLLLHEETIPEMLQALTSKILKDERQISPVIVDGKTLVVLDGMHRVEALRKLKCKFICACFVDYMSERIRVERWCRTVSEWFDPIIVFEKNGLELIPVSIEASIEDKPLLILSNNRYLIKPSKKGIQSAFEAVRILEIYLKHMDNQVGYDPEHLARERLEAGSIFAVICPPKIDKKHVLESALNERLFIPKATRHVFPARVIAADAPLPLLQNKSLSIQKANAIFLEALNHKRLKRLQPGAILNGRRYEEDLYLFE
ncbi:MAG: hypothetical protein ACUVV4_07400 [Candidatus Bathyarchaeia archaeon]